MGFPSFRSYVDVQDNLGQSWVSGWRKVPANLTAAGVWTDLSMAPGNPPANFYASEPLIAATLPSSKGIYTGPNVSPATKHLTRLSSMTGGANGAPLVMLLCDYLLYYPFIDMDSLDVQLFDNTVVLPRRESFVAPRAFMVALSNFTGSGVFTYTYTNSSGVAGRVSPAITCNSVNSPGTLIHSSPSTAGTFGPFLPMQAGDIGVQSVQSVQFSVPNGGLAAIVLADPLDNTLIVSQTAPAERDFARDITSLTRIQAGACLNFLALPNASLATVPLLGTAEFAWN
ncbi:MAG: hypothetical protein K2Y02_04780 [Burkholderiaceae bacterium]|nr:hypothetical protein [Burkholderiaceae bacterium]